MLVEVLCAYEYERKTYRQNTDASCNSFKLFVSNLWGFCSANSARWKTSQCVRATLDDGDRTAEHITYCTHDVQIYRIIGQVLFGLCAYEITTMHYENKVAVAID